MPLYVEINSLIVFNSYYWNHAVMHIWRHYCVQIWMYAFLGLITSVRIDGSLSIYTQLWTWQLPEHCTNIYAQHIHTHTHTPHKCFLYFTDIFSMLLQTLNCQYLHFLCLKAFKMWKKGWPVKRTGRYCCPTTLQWIAQGNWSVNPFHSCLGESNSEVCVVLFIRLSPLNWKRGINIKYKM